MMKPVGSPIEQESCESGRNHNSDDWRDFGEGFHHENDAVKRSVPSCFSNDHFHSFSSPWRGPHLNTRRARQTSGRWSRRSWTSQPWAITLRHCIAMLTFLARSLRFRWPSPVVFMAAMASASWPPPFMFISLSCLRGWHHCVCHFWLSAQLPAGLSWDHGFNWCYLCVICGQWNESQVCKNMPSPCARIWDQGWFLR